MKKVHKSEERNQKKHYQTTLEILTADLTSINELRVVCIEKRRKMLLHKLPIGLLFYTYRRTLRVKYSDSVNV